jgi:hypothetical protein
MTNVAVQTTVFELCRTMVRNVKPSSRQFENVWSLKDNKRLENLNNVIKLAKGGQFHKSKQITYTRRLVDTAVQIIATCRPDFVIMEY